MSKCRVIKEETSISTVQVDEKELEIYSKILGKGDVPLQVKVKGQKNAKKFYKNTLNMIGKMAKIEANEEFVQFTYYKIEKTIKEITELERRVVMAKNLKNLNIAIFNYNEMLNNVYKIQLHILDKKISTEDQKALMKKLTDEKISIISGKSITFTKLKKYKDAVEMDLSIIRDIDDRYDPSYGRLIQNYLILGDVKNARFYADKMKSLFKQYILDEYANVFKELETKEKQPVRSSVRLSVQKRK